MSCTPFFTIGTTGTSAEHFFGRLRDAGVAKVIDTRLWASSQLAGFAKKKDLPFFLQEIAGIAYEHRPLLAPSEDILKPFKAGTIGWPEYERRYTALLDARQVTSRLNPAAWDRACFLCACARPDHCHRRLFVEYVGRAWPRRFTVTHL